MQTLQTLFRVGRAEGGEGLSLQVRMLARENVCKCEWRGQAGWGVSLS